MVQTKQTMGPFSSGRHRPFLLLGLLFVIVVLMYNVWSLRLKNMELTEKVNLLNYKLNTITAKKLTLDKRTSALANRLVELDQMKRNSDQTCEELKRELNDDKKKLEQNLDNLKDQVSQKEEKFNELHSSLVSIFIPGK